MISQEGEKYLPDALSRGTSEQLFLAVRLGAHSGNPTAAAGGLR